MGMEVKWMGVERFPLPLPAMTEKDYVTVMPAHRTPDQPPAPPITYQLAPHEALVYVNQSSKVPPGEDTVKFTSVVLRDYLEFGKLRIAMTSVASEGRFHLGESKKMALGFIFDPVAGLFAIKPDPDMDRFVLAESFSIVKNDSLIDNAAYAFLNGTFITDKYGTILRVQASILGRHPELIHPIDAEAALFELGYCLKHNFLLPDSTSILDYPPGAGTGLEGYSGVLKKSNITDLGSLIRNFKQ